MPVLRSTTEYVRPSGKRKRIRLYEAWGNMRGRASGRLHAGNGARPWKGLTVDWPNWRDFRKWALANGYSKTLCSLDRQNTSKGYGPGNCEWVTRAENTRRMSFYMHHASDNTCPF